MTSALREWVGSKATKSTYRLRECENDQGRFWTEPISEITQPQLYLMTKYAGMVKPAISRIS